MQKLSSFQMLSSTLGRLKIQPQPKRVISGQNRKRVSRDGCGSYNPWWMRLLQEDRKFKANMDYIVRTLHIKTRVFYKLIINKGLNAHLEQIEVLFKT